MALRPRLIFDVKRNPDFDGIAYGPVSVGNYIKPFFFVRSGEEIDKDSIAVYESNTGHSWKEASNIRIKWADVHHKAVTVSYSGKKAFIQLVLPSEMEVIFMASGYINALADDVACENVSTVIEGVDCSLYEGWEFPKCVDKLKSVAQFYPEVAAGKIQTVAALPSATIQNDKPDFSIPKIGLREYCTIGTITQGQTTISLYNTKEKVVFLLGCNDSYLDSSLIGSKDYYKRIIFGGGAVSQTQGKIILGMYRTTDKSITYSYSTSKKSPYWQRFISCDSKLFKDVSDKVIFSNIMVTNGKSLVIDGLYINNITGLLYDYSHATNILIERGNVSPLSKTTTATETILSMVASDRYISITNNNSSYQVDFFLYFNPSILAVDA